MDGTKLNIPANDDGGELDPHGADGNGPLLFLPYSPPPLIFTPLPSRVFIIARGRSQIYRRP